MTRLERRDHRAEAKDIQGDHAIRTLFFFFWFYLSDKEAKSQATEKSRPKVIGIGIGSALLLRLVTEQG